MTSKNAYSIAKSFPRSIKGSTTVSIIAYPIETYKSASEAINTLKLHPSIASADTLASAYLLPDKTTFSDDHKESAFGSTALSALKSSSAFGVAVVVARFWGGVNCGNVRFEHVKGTVLEALERAGHVKGRDIREARWGKTGEGIRVGGGGEGCGRLSREEIRKRRMEILGGGGEGGGGKKQRRTKEEREEDDATEVIDLTGDD